MNLIIIKKKMDYIRNIIYSEDNDYIYHCGHFDNSRTYNDNLLCRKENCSIKHDVWLCNNCDKNEINCDNLYKMLKNRNGYNYLFVNEVKCDYCERMNNMIYKKDDTNYKVCRNCMYNLNIKEDNYNIYFCKHDGKKIYWENIFCTKNNCKMQHDVWLCNNCNKNINCDSLISMRKKIDKFNYKVYNKCNKCNYCDISTKYFYKYNNYIICWKCANNKKYKDFYQKVKCFCNNGLIKCNKCDNGYYYCICDKGRIKCIKCINGKIQCHQCIDGFTNCIVYEFHTCNLCNNTGMKRCTISRCNFGNITCICEQWSGYIPCPQCRGEGRKRCNCFKGFFKCNNCEGKGSYKIIK